MDAIIQKPDGDFPRVLISGQEKQDAIMKCTLM